MIKYSEKVRKTVALFFHPFNDIDVFVEDINDHTFYKTLLSRLTNEQYKIERIITLGGRLNVIDTCKNDQTDGGRPRIYIIDGDLNLLIEAPIPKLKRLYCLDVYCIENYLIDEGAALQVLFENDGRRDREELRKLLDFENWLSSSNELVNLFIVFGVAKKLNSSFATVSMGVSRILKNLPKGPILDIRKLTALKEQIKNALIKEYGLETVTIIEKELTTKWLCIRENILKIVSGKDFLLPLLRHRMNTIVRDEYPINSLRLRLALWCSTSRLIGLKGALESISKGQIDFSLLNKLNVEKIKTS